MAAVLRPLQASENLPQTTNFILHKQVLMQSKEPIYFRETRDTITTRYTIFWNEESKYVEYVAK